MANNNSITLVGNMFGLRTTSAFSSISSSNFNLIPKAGGTFTGDVNLGVDDTGVDLKLFGATASAYILWDASDDALKTGGTATIDIVQDKLKIVLRK